MSFLEISICYRLGADMIRSAGGVAALVTDNTHSALMLPQSAASPDLDTSLNTTTAAVSEAEVSMLKFRRSRSSGTYSVTRPGQRQERHEDTGEPPDT